jgi:fatty acid desaturase
MCAYSWRQQHVFRHHFNNDNWGGASKWEYEKDTFIRSIVYSIRKSAAMYWYPLKEAVVKSHHNPTIGPVNYHAALLQHVATHIVTILLIVIEPCFYIPYYLFVYFFTTKTDYENHVGCDKSEYGFSNNTLDLSYNYVRNNFGYHTAHHYYPKAHWTELPALHKKICSKIPSKCISQKIWTGYWTPPLIVHVIGLINSRIACPVPNTTSIRLSLLNIRSH